MVLQKEEQKSTFINLSNITFAKYYFVYKVNDAYSIDELSKFRAKHQLFFQKVENKNQHLNLIFVDSVFTNILADVAIEVFLGKASSFAQYSNLESKIKVVTEKDERIYFRYKFLNFIHLLLYSDISSENIFNGDLFYNRIYCLRNELGEIDYFSIYDHNILQEKLIHELKLKIDIGSSVISNKEVKLCLKIHF